MEAVLYKWGAVILLSIILVLCVLLPLLATCAPNWSSPLFTLGLADRVVVLG